MNERLQTRLDEIKTHFKTHKREYLIGTSCFVAGGMIGAALMMRQRSVINNASDQGIINYGDNPTVNQITQTVSEYGNKLGAGGNKVVELDEYLWPKRQPAFNTQHRAAQNAGVSDYTMWKHLNTGEPINDKTYMRLRDWIDMMFGGEDGVPEGWQEWLQSRKLAA